MWSSFKPRFDEFEIVRLIGTGNFSEVFHAVYTGPAKSDAARYAAVADCVGRSFALKCIEKAKVAKLQKQAEVIMEKECLRKLNDPSHSATAGWENVIQLKWTFQDAQSLYIVTEYCPDGELWELTTGVGVMDEELLKCYAAQLVNAIEYVHSRGILHRDLKCENLVLSRNSSRQGALKVIDFGTALDVERPELESAGNAAPGPLGKRAPFRNFVGSANFMAPEVVRNKSSGFSCDLWSLGCTLYQMAAGKAPFEAPSDFLTHLSAQNLILDFPPHFPPALKDLILRLLQLEPSARLPIPQIKLHPFFAGVDFADTLSHLKRAPGSPQPLPERPPLPSLLNLCFSHMSRNWDRFRQKWEAAGWPTQLEDDCAALGGGSPCGTGRPRVDGGEGRRDLARWLRPPAAGVATLEVESRTIMQEFLAADESIEALRDRLLWWKKMDLRLQDESFWDSLTQQFMMRQGTTKTDDSHNGKTSNFR